MHGAAPLEKALAQAVDGEGGCLPSFVSPPGFPRPSWRASTLGLYGGRARSKRGLARKPAPPPEVLAAAHGAVRSSRAVLGSGRNELQPPSKLDSTALGKWSLYSGHKTRFSE